MRFAAAATLFASVALAHYSEEAPESTVYSTDYVTITSCGPTVTNCPAKSTVVSSTVYPVTTSTIYSTTVKTVTSCAPTVTNCPAHSTVVVTETIPVSTTICPLTGISTTKYYNTTSIPAVTTYPPVETTPVESYPVSSPVETTTYEETTTAAPVCPTSSVKTISTSITTVIPTVIYETVAVPCPTTYAPSSGFPSPSGNGTVPSSTKPPQATVTAGAATMGGSVMLAAAAGLVALMA